MITKNDLDSTKSSLETSRLQLESLKKCLLLNADATREQYDYWISNVLYARSFEENIGRSIRIGKLRKPENVDCIII